MSFADFIEQNLEAILREWEQFARTVPAATHMDAKALRDEAGQILMFVAEDMRHPQSGAQQKAKSHGRAQKKRGQPDTVAELHAVRRFRDGFDLPQMTSEYRALRASVIRLWMRQMDSADRGRLNELVRFNEAIDQVLTESTARFYAKIQRARELFLGVLGHDLRSPLGAVLNSAQYLLNSSDLPPQERKAASRIFSSGKRLQSMISDLLDVARTRLGESLPILRKQMDIGECVRRAIAEAEAFHPEALLHLEARGALSGSWDERRIHQLVTNLLENAVRHGSKQDPVTISINGRPEQVVLTVRNLGVPIPEKALRQIFEPLARGETDRGSESANDSLGLGLYIARQIVLAHGGSIDVTSSEEAGTTFTVCLVRTG